MSALLAMEDVHVRLDGKDVLNGVSFQLLPRERLAIVGANGTGKTTLLRTLVGLQPRTGGQVKLLGRACSTEREFHALRPRIGFLFQDSDDQLFCPSVIEDVSFGPLNLGLSEADAISCAGKALEGLGIGHLADRFSHKLSGGEKRLVCLAGLLAMTPDVLLLDEPTNGVDSDYGRRLRSGLLSFPGAMILVSHDDGFVAELATRALLLTDGKLEDAELHSHAHVHRHLHAHARQGEATGAIFHPDFESIRPK